MARGSREPIDTMRLAGRGRAEVLGLVHARGARRGPGDEAGPAGLGLLVPYACDDAVMTLLQRGGWSDDYLVLPRLLSRLGMVLVHGRFVHPHAACRLVIRTTDGEAVGVDATVQGCTHLAGTLHELTLRFAEPIDLPQFVGLSHAEADRLRRELALAQDAAARDASAGALLVEPWDADARLFALWLSGMGLRARRVESAEALGALRSLAVDLLLVDATPGPGGGLGLIERARAVGLSGPIVAVSAQDGDALASRAEAAGASVYLSKPLDAEGFRSAVGVLLGLGPAGEPEPLRSTAADDPAMAGLVAQFVAAAADRAAALRRAHLGEDLEYVARVCRQLKSTGSPCGFEPVTRTARTVLERIRQPEPDLDSVRASVNELVALLRRVRG